MSSQLPLLDSPWIDAIGWSLVHSTWQIVVVALAFVLVRYALRRRSASARYLCGCLALSAMVTWPMASLVSQSGKQPTTTVLALPSTFSPVAANAGPSSTSPAVGQQVEPPAAEESPTSPPRPAQAESASDFLQLFAADWRETFDPVVPWLTLAWFFGVSLLAIRPLWGLWTVQRLKTCGLAPLETKIRRLAGELMVRMYVHDSVQFAASSLVDVPTVVGYLRPIVLVPASALSGLSVDQLELVLAHELAHIRRHDYLVNLAQTVVESLLFYHPAVWWVSREVRRERENCCDDAAIELRGNREEYARALYALETQCRAAVPALAANGGSLVTRIRRLLGRTPAPTGFDRSIPWAAGLIVLLLLSALITLGPAVAGEKLDDGSAKPELAAAADGNQSDSPIVEKPKASGLKIDGVNVDEVLASLATYQSCPDKEQLRKKFIAAVREIRRRNQGHVIIGRLQMELGDSPTQAFAQMEILNRGYFAGPTKDLQNPVGFRNHGYAPYDLELQGTHGKIVDVGELQMKRLEPADLVSFNGQVRLAEGDDLSEVRVTLSVSTAPINTPSNGYEPRSDWPQPIKISLEENGKFRPASLSPITYDLLVTAPGYVPQRRRVEIEPGKAFDVGTIMLERPRRVRLEYISSKQTPFTKDYANVDVLHGGARWNVTQANGRWDLEFDQRENRLYFGWSYGPLFLADLGPGKLEEFLRVEAGTAHEQPHNMEVKNGHVYLLRRPDHEQGDRAEHFVLFKVQFVGERTSEPPASELVPTISTEPQQQRKRWIAVGRVTDEHGTPMTGVEISASCGVGSLFPTGSTTTDADGKYRLPFGPGIHLSVDTNALQAATITASKPGYFEHNLCRHGSCLAGERLPEDADERWGSDKDRVFLPGIPKTLDFVMNRAAILEGTFSETSSHGFVRAQSFELVGAELPPSSSVLTSAATDANGRFRIDGIPTGKEWRISMRVPHTFIEIETDSFKFDQPGIYRCRVQLNATSGSDGAKMSLRFDDLEQVATADQIREIDALDAEGFSKLHRAASGGHVERVRTLLDSGADVDVEQGTYHGTPLQYAATQGHGETVQALLERHASVDARDTRGRTPLLWAASNGHADVVQRLLDAGANINAAANGGWTALHYAVDRGHTVVAQLLIDRGADLRLKNSNGATPFDLNPKLDLQIPWQSLQQSTQPRPTAESRRPTKRQEQRDERPLPDHSADLVVATFRKKPIRWRDLTPPADWYKQRAEYLRKHGHTLGFETPDVYVMTRLRSKVQSPLFEAYRVEQRLAPTDAELAEFRRHWRAAKTARIREPGQPDMTLDQTTKQEEIFAKFYVGNWKLQCSLFHKYGGRAIYQQVGPEAIDAMRDFLKENEANDVFTILDPQLRSEFWEPFTRENPGVVIPNPEKVFEHPWSAFE